MDTNQETNSMMKRLSFCLLAIICQSCSEPAAPATSVDGIMELRSGNRWVGRTSGEYGRVDVLEVTGDTMIGSDRWSRIAVSSGAGSGISQLRPDHIHGPYLINQSDGLYLSSHVRAGDRVKRIIKYPVSIGDTAIDKGWFQTSDRNGRHGPRFHELGIVTAVGEKLTVEAGTFDVFKVEFRSIRDSVNSIGAGVQQYDAAWFAPRVGLIRAEKYDANGGIAASWELIELKLN